jgi:hypothetical protein
VYRAQWFNPRDGTWSDVEGGRLTANTIGLIKLMNIPRKLDWGLKLVYEGPLDANLINKKVSHISPLKKNARTLGYVTAGLFILLLMGFLIRRPSAKK